MPNAEMVFNVLVYHDSLAVIQESQNSGPSQLLKYGWSRCPYRNYLPQTNEDAPCHQNMPRGRYLHFPCLKYVTPPLLFFLLLTQSHPAVQSLYLQQRPALPPPPSEAFLKEPYFNPEMLYSVRTTHEVCISACEYQVLLETGEIKFLKCIKIGFITETTSQHENSLRP